MALPFRTVGRAPGSASSIASRPAEPAVGGNPTADARPLPTPWPARVGAPRRGPASDPAADAATLSDARRCEAALLDDLLALLDALRQPLDALPDRPVSVAALGGALAELERAERVATAPADAIAERRRRLLALSAASASLGALLDQRRRGLLPDPALDARRSAILARLAPFLATDET